MTKINEAIERLQRGGVSIREAARIYGVPYSTLRDRFSGERSARPAKQPQQFQEIAPAQTIDGRAFVISTAISASEPQHEFLNAIKNYCRIHSAKFLVIPRTYKHKLNNIDEDDAEYQFAAELKPYMVSNRIILHDNLTLLADVPILPTNSNPLSGVETMTGGDSAIVGHPRVHLRSVPVRVGAMPKLVLTTGAITKPRYSQSFAGAKGEFNHSIAAAVVVVRDDGLFDVRHIHYDGKSGFHDLGHHYTKNTVTESPVLSMTFGDLHAAHACDDVADATWRDSDSLVEQLQPDHIVLHDVLDNNAINPHHGYFEKFANYARGENRLIQELQNTAKMVCDIAERTNAKIYCVASNHDEFIDRWLSKNENADDLTNAIVYHETKLAILRSIESGRAITGWKYWAKRLIPLENVKILSRNDSLIIGGVEHGYHGDKGANGARGSIRAYSRVGLKTTIGHAHAPGIMDGCYQVGACQSSEETDYVQGGLSGWLTSHCVQYRDGHRTLIHIIGK